jgi:amino acid transporter, AAT family
MNLVVITAALSSANTNLYLSTRMLYSLSRGQYAPVWLGRVSSNGVPHHALFASTAGMVAAILLAVFAPKKAFLLLYGTAVAGMFFVWIVILLTHLRFRRAIGRERLSRLPLKLPAHPFPTLAAILVLLAIVVSTFQVEGLRYSIPAFGSLLLVMSVGYLRSRARAR